MTQPTTPYNTLEEIQLRRTQLSEAIDQEGDKIGELWHELFKHDENATKGEYIATMINHGIMAIDAFLLVRKLMKNYGRLFDFFGSKRKKRK